MTSAAFQGPAVELARVSKAYGRAAALDNVDLTLDRGRTLVVLGPNGSGKTTLIKILASISKPDSGSARIAGLDLARHGTVARRFVGVVTHDPLLYDELTGRENLRFAARMFDIDDADDRIHAVSDRIDVSARLDHRVGALSHGWKKRISLARALLHDPPILLMDEPESGLDQQAIAAFERAVDDETRPNRTVVMTTHDIERALHLADQIAILAKGRLVYRQTVSDEHDADALREIYARRIASAK